METANNQELIGTLKAAFALLDEVCKPYINSRYLAEELGISALDTNKLLIHAGMIVYVGHSYHLTEKSLKNGWGRATETGIKWTPKGRVEARRNLAEVLERKINLQTILP